MNRILRALFFPLAESAERKKKSRKGMHFSIQLHFPTLFRLQFYNHEIDHYYRATQPSYPFRSGKVPFSIHEKKMLCGRNEGSNTHNNNNNSQASNCAVIPNSKWTQPEQERKRVRAKREKIHSNLWKNLLRVELYIVSISVLSETSNRSTQKFI